MSLVLIPCMCIAFSLLFDSNRTAKIISMPGISVVSTKLIILFLIDWKISLLYF